MRIRTVVTLQYKTPFTINLILLIFIHVILNLYGKRLNAQTVSSDSTSTYRHYQPKVNWKFETSGSVISRPALSEDKLFFGCNDSIFYCITTGGKLIWKYRTQGKVNSSPGISGDKIFFSSGDGNLYSLNKINGKLIWKFSTNGEKQFSARGIHGQEPKDSVFTDEWDFWLSSPILYEHKIYFGSGDSYFYCVDEDTGDLIWKYKTSNIIHSSPAIKNGKVYFGSWDTYFYCLTSESGKLLWQFKTGEDTIISNQTGITAEPLVEDSVVYFGCRDSHLYALNALTGKMIWCHYNDRGWVSVRPLHYKNKIIYGSGSDKKFLALNASTGDSIYIYKTTGADFSPPIAHKNTIIYGDFNGVLYSRNGDTGILNWSFRIPVTDSLQIINKDMTINQKAYADAVEKFKGKLSPMQIRLSAGAFLAEPLIAGNTVYIGSTDNGLFSVDIDSDK